MNKNTARSRYFEARSKAAEFLNGIKAENRALTDDEEAQMKQYRSELAEAELEMQIENGERFAAAFRSMDATGSKRDRALNFAAAMVAAANGAPIEVRSANDRDSVAADTPLTIGDIIEPLEKGNILGLLGCKVQTGLVGAWKYPVVAAIEAAIAGESAEISDSALSISAVQPTPRRVALSILVTRGALNATNYELRDIVLDQIVKGLDRLLNKWMFKEDAVATGVNGLFVSPGTSAEMASTAPTYAEVLSLKASVDATGVKPDGTAAYVMTNAMRAVLEATPKGSTTGGMILEDGKINGVPVYVTEYAPASCIEFGYFSYALVGQFGNTEVIVDPFTKTTSNSVRFVLNTDFDIKAARPEAFGILVPKNGGQS